MRSGLASPEPIPYISDIAKVVLGMSSMMWIRRMRWNGMEWARRKRLSLQDWKFILSSAMFGNSYSSPFPFPVKIDQGFGSRSSVQYSIGLQPAVLTPFQGWEVGGKQAGNKLARSSVSVDAASSSSSS